MTETTRDNTNSLVSLLSGNYCYRLGRISMGGGYCSGLIRRDFGRDRRIKFSRFGRFGVSGAVVRTVGRFFFSHCCKIVTTTAPNSFTIRLFFEVTVGGEGQAVVAANRRKNEREKYSRIFKFWQSRNRTFKGESLNHFWPSE